MICGHYGSGKTNLAMNLALKAAQNGESVTLMDLDIVNPYFRSSDYKELLDSKGIKLIAPAFAHSNLDLPSLTAEMYSIFASQHERIILDVGGDDQGATALGRFSKQLDETGYEMLYVINKYRPLSKLSAEATELLTEIEQASRLKATGVVNNSHLMGETTAQTILNSIDYAQNTADEAGLPLLATVAERRLIPELEGKLTKLLPVDILVTNPITS
jgi:MinD-like ATPase involved in chromosome partitioning or flagellar assembly